MLHLCPIGVSSVIGFCLFFVVHFVNLLDCVIVIFIVVLDVRS
jgi:hypothetical protein